MSITLAIAVYFVIWWTVLFAVLPLGVKSQYEHGDVVPGTEGAAPHKPMLLKKLGSSRWYRSLPALEFLSTR